MKSFFGFWGRHRILLTIVSGVIISGLYFGYYSFFKETKSEVQLQIEEVEKGDIEIVVNGSGQIQAVSQVDLEPQIAGDGLDIVGILVEDDQLVSEGDLIAILDSEEAEEDVRDARLSLYDAQIQYSKIAEEYDNQTVEEVWERQLAQNNVEAASNKLNDALDELEEYKITAPFDGIVTGLDYEAGDSISRDEVLASVITDELQAEISLNEIDAVKINKGDSATLTFDIMGDEVISGEVSKIDTIGKVSSGVVSYDVVVSFVASSDLLKPGMSVEVDIEVESSENVLTIPVSAIKEDQNGEEYVLVTENGSESSRPEKRMIQTGITDDVSIEIISGLSEGELIITGQASKNSGTASAESEGKSSGIFNMGGGRPPGK